MEVEKKFVRVSFIATRDYLRFFFLTIDFVVHIVVIAVESCSRRRPYFLKCYQLTCCILFLSVIVKIGLF